MPSKRSIIGVASLADGRFIAAATDRRQNWLWQLGSTGWSQLAAWNGKELTACCAVGEAVVCAALDGQLYSWSAGKLSTHSLPDHTMRIYGACALDERRAVLGGSDGLVFFDPRSRALEHRRLGAYEIRNAGRTIHGIRASDGRILIVGAKNLVLELRGETLVELANQATFGGRELHFQSAVLCRGRLWLSTFGALASLDEKGAKFYDDLPVDRNRGFGLACHGGELLVFQDGIMRGEPGAWRPLVSGFRTEGLVAVEPLGDDRWCAISSLGAWYPLDGDTIEPLVTC